MRCDNKAAVIELTDANFGLHVMASDKPVLVDFWAEWCMPCKMLAPTIDELAQEYAGKMIVGKVDTDSQREVSRKLNISAIPTLILYKNGHVFRKFIGLQQKRDIKAAIDDVIKSVPCMESVAAAEMAGREQIETIRRVIASDPITYRDGFLPWLQTHWAVWEAFCRYTFALINAGRKRYSSKTIIAVIRYERDVVSVSDGDGFKINDRWQAGMGRLFMALYPEHNGFFPTRDRRGGTTHDGDEYWQ